ncbi:hypothetical protein GCM10009743_01140 [Kribbella swartbergensis]
MATTPALAVSAITLTRRGPTRSINGPPIALKTTSGAISASATNPVFNGEPVVTNTNHGTAMALTRVPQIDTTLATKNAANAPRPAFTTPPTSPLNSNRPPRTTATSRPRAARHEPTTSRPPRAAREPPTTSRPRTAHHKPPAAFP